MGYALPTWLMAWHNDQWLAMIVHDAKLTSVIPYELVLGTQQSLNGPNPSYSPLPP